MIKILTMKNIYKILALLLMSLTIVVTSCKKEDEVVAPTVINGCTDNTMFNYDPAATTDDGSCISFIYGCTDDAALNYNPLANTLDNSCCYIAGCTDSIAVNYNPLACYDDGSCLPPFYDIAQGTWNISPDCEEIDVLGQIISLNEQMPETIDVQGNGDNSLSIDMNGSQVSGNIDNEGNILVNEQTISVDFSGIPIPVQISGTGKIESENLGYMDLIYSGEIDIIPNVPIPIPFSATCHIVLSK